MSDDRLIPTFIRCGVPVGSILTLTGLNLGPALIAASVRRVRSEAAKSRLRQMWSEERVDLAEHLSAPQRVCSVALHHDEMIGGAVCLKTDEYAVFFGLFVRPAFRRQQVGRLILSQMAVSTRVLAPRRPIYFRAVDGGLLMKTAVRAGFEELGVDLTDEGQR